MIMPEFFVVDIGDDAVDFATLRSAIRAARAFVTTGGVYRDGIDTTVDAASVYSVRDGAMNPWYAIWRDERGAVQETKDRALARGIYFARLAPPKRRHPLLRRIR